ncbi:MAG: hypothetical protein ACRDVZ_10300 [Jiangellaceae bacterium]
MITGSGLLTYHLHGDDWEIVTIGPGWGTVEAGQKAGQGGGFVGGAVGRHDGRVPRTREDVVHGCDIRPADRGDVHHVVGGSHDSSAYDMLSGMFSSMFIT